MIYWYITSIHICKHLADTKLGSFERFCKLNRPYLELFVTHKFFIPEFLPGCDNFIVCMHIVTVKMRLKLLMENFARVQIVISRSTIQRMSKRFP